MSVLFTTQLTAAIARSFWRNVVAISAAVLLVFSLVLGPFATLPVQAASGWQTVGNTGVSSDGVYHFSIAVSPSGTPYVAHTDADDNHRLTVQKFASGSWQTVGNTTYLTAGRSVPPALAVSPSGTLYLAYGDEANNHRATVKKLVGGSWQTVGTAGFSPQSASFLTLDFSPSGTPYVAYGDEANGHRATVQKFANGSWQTVGTAGFSSSSTNYTQIAIGASDIPYAAYQEQASAKLTVEKFAGGSWQTVGAGSVTKGYAFAASLAISPSGVPHFAYTDRTSGSDIATVKKFASGSWQAVSEVGISAGAVYNTTLKYSPSGTLYVAYQDGDGRNANVKKLVDGNWQTVGTTNFSPGNAIYMEFTVSPSGTPYVAYLNDVNDIRSLIVQKYDPPVPVIDSLTPSDDAMSAGHDADLAMTFNIPVTVSSGTITIKQSTDNFVVETIDVTSDQVTGSGTDTITLDPSANLTKGTGYYVQIDATAFVGDTGKNFAGIADNTTWNFATAPNAAPTVAITAPTGGASLPEDQAFTITADAADTDGTVTSVEFFVGSTSLGTDTTAPYSASTTVTDPSTVSLTAVATDNNGDTTTSSAVLATITDETIPAVQSLTPADNTIDVAIDTNFSLTFDEPVNWNTGDILIKKASDGSVVQTIAAGSDTTTGDGSTTLTINLPDDLTYGTQYYIEVPTTAIGDLAGNDVFAGIAGSATWNFATMDNDGVATSEEAAAPNGGDGNNDGRPDSTQANVAAFKSPLTGNYVVLTVGDTCQIESTSLQTEAVQTEADDNYKYPFGLLNFTASCGDMPGFTTTITQHYYQPVDEDLVLRKVMDGAYSTVDNATIAAKTIGSDSAVVVSYQVTDGGALDADGQANGTIVDPVGLGVDAAAGAPDTGLQSKNMAIFGMAILAGAGLLVGVVTPLRRKVYRVFKETA